MSLMSSSLVVTMRFCFVCELAGHMKEVTNQSRKVVDDSIYPITVIVSRLGWMGHSGCPDDVQSQLLLLSQVFSALTSS